MSTHTPLHRVPLDSQKAGADALRRLTKRQPGLKVERFSFYHYRLTFLGVSADYWPRTERALIGGQTRTGISASQLFKLIRSLAEAPHVD